MVVALMIGSAAASGAAAGVGALLVHWRYGTIDVAGAPVSPEHRVFWERGRFFYTVRNALYSMYKFQIPRSRRVLGGVAFLVKGIRNGVFLHTLRAIMASRGLSRDFRNCAGEAAAYRLTPATWSYIFQYERSRNDSLMTKIRRQLSLLPRQGNLSERPRT